MAPVTIAGALTLAHAEALAGIDARADRAARGADRLRQLHLQRRHEIGLAGLRHAGIRQGGVRRRPDGALLGLPWRSSNATASNTPDAQSAYESQMSLWGALFGGCNFVLHAAGWLESGLTTSYEKFMLDIEMLQMFAEVFQPVGASRRRSCPRCGRRGRPGRPFLRLRAHHGALPQRVLRAAGLGLAQLRPVDRRRRQDRDRARHRRSGGTRSSVMSRPARDPAVVEALDAYVARRTEEGGAPPVT